MSRYDTARNGGHLSPSPIFEFDSIATTHGLENAISAVALEDRATKNVIDLIVKHGWEEDVDLVRGGNVSGCNQIRSSEDTARRLTW